MFFPCSTRFFFSTMGSENGFVCPARGNKVHFMARQQKKFILRNLRECPYLILAVYFYVFFRNLCGYIGINSNTNQFVSRMKNVKFFFFLQQIRCIILFFLQAASSHRIFFFIKILLTQKYFAVYLIDTHVLICRIPQNLRN